MESLRTASASCLGCMVRRSLTAAARRPTSTSLAAAPAANVFLTLQTRGKKTRRHDQGVVVRLLEDISQFGRKDAIIRVERGRMRNFWYPNGMAEYMTSARLAAAGVSAADAVVPRDPLYVAATALLPDHDDDASLSGRRRRPTIALRTVDAPRAANLLETLLPPTLVFYRKPISADTAAIFGSVSADDVATALRELLRASPDTEAALVRVEPRDVRFIVPPPPVAAEGAADTPGGELDQAASTDRVKALGRWEVEISVRGSHGSHGSHGGELANASLAAAAAAAVGGGGGSVAPVRKTVEILAQE